MGIAPLTFREAITQGIDSLRPPAGQAALASTTKETSASLSPGDSALAGGMIRESWVSFASTAASRDSAVPSLFSVRASTASAATRYSVRQSSIESAVFTTSPTYHEDRKDNYPRGPRYFCTFCDAVFNTDTEWKLHEFEFHDRREQYMCRSCSTLFSRATLLTEHLEHSHGVEDTDTISEPVGFCPIRSAWGCGFCGAAVESRTDYLEHVGEHYDEGKDKSDWQHTRVIEGLLRQPKIAPAWLALVTREEHARGARLRFLWDPDTTGRSTDESGPRRLQDMLEYFTTGSMGADEVAAIAFSNAHVRLEGNVSDLISKLYLRNPEAKSTKWSSDPIQSSPDLQPTSPNTEDDVMSPISPLPASLRPPTTPPQIRPPLHPDTRLNLQSPSAAPAPSGLAATAKPVTLRRSALRRIESSRNLSFANKATLTETFDRPALDKLQSIRSLDASPISNQRRLKSRSRSFQSTADFSWASDRRPALSAAGSVRPHNSSSTLSTHTRDSSAGHGDSTSELLSDDSFSEPDSWLEPSGIPTATRPWRITFQQTVDGGMERLWVRYNQNWEALVRQCVGDRSTDSTRYRDTPGRVRKGGASGYGSNKGFRTNRLLGQEEEDDDEGEGYRPPSSLSKRSLGSAKRFACPFRKHDPHTYNIHEHEVCAIRSWSTISRLKEHLYRRHYKVHCQRCKRIFSDARQLAEHEMSIVACEVLDIGSPSDITTHQEKQLKSRKHTTRRQTDEEKWRDIYRLLFPGDQIPSPYPEATDDMAPTSSESHASLHFQHFLLNEMPALFTRTAEEHAGRRLQAQEGLALETIPGIIEDALQKAFRAWETRGNELPTREASEASMSFLPETPTSLAYNFNQSTTYQDVPPQTMDTDFAQAHLGDTNFAIQALHTTSADDSGFSEGSFFTSAPPGNFSTFAPHYHRGTWESSLGLLGVSAFETDGSPGAHFQGFQGR
ncbi:hypothetical protein C7999DRAFT_14431 [Corynascus novoguineensis]|uniref:C2H2-type domain-containing protein n=1 Tax=Corynascus novoguineensis TaxID=1126955 RepID=A0AAN7HFC2_9PEZI|nr:hypothetical protein C7999DRAFT_14431 [Corynascus novoguineensis]